MKCSPCRLSVLGLSIVFSAILVSDTFVPDDPIALKYTAHQAGFDLRLPIVSQDYPLSAIGKLINRNGSCSATMLSRYWAISNAHCVCKQDKCTVEDWQSLNFHPNYYNGKSILVSYADFILRGKPKSKTDYVLIRLRSPLGDLTGWLGYTFNDFKDVRDWGDKLFMGGYPSDHKKGEVGVFYVRCGVTADRGELGWKHDCNSAPGSSGSSLGYVKDKKYFVTALNWGGSNDNDDGVAAPLSAFSTEVEKIEKYSKPGNTAAHFCNFTGKELFVAVAYWASFTEKWYSKGFVKVKVNTCEEGMFPGVYTKDRKEAPFIYYYAQNGQREWQGGNLAGRNFCFSSREAFDYVDADKCTGSSNSKKFKPHQIEYDTVNFIKFE